jgi:hypothetical protein
MIENIVCREVADDALLVILDSMRSFCDLLRFSLDIDCEHSALKDDAGNIFAWVYVVTIMRRGGKKSSKKASADLSAPDGVPSTASSTPLQSRSPTMSPHVRGRSRQLPKLKPMQISGSAPVLVDTPIPSLGDAQTPALAG